MSKARSTHIHMEWGALLSVIFVVLKLTEVSWFATASWWWVLAFAFAPLAIILSLIAVLFLTGLLGISIGALADWLLSGKKVK